MVAFVLSSLIGLLRQVLVAGAFGTQADIEAFNAANRVSETLFNLVAGEMRPDQGAVAFNGKDVTRTPVYKRCREGIARTYQGL